YATHDKDSDGLSVGGETIPDQPNYIASSVSTADATDSSTTASSSSNSSESSSQSSSHSVAAKNGAEKKKATKNADEVDVFETLRDMTRVTRFLQHMRSMGATQSSILKYVHANS